MSECIFLAETVSCPVTIAGRNPSDREENAGATIKVEAVAAAAVVEAAAEVAVGTKTGTDATTTTGLSRCREMSAWNRICSVRAILVSILANMKIYLLKQPGTTSRLTLHL